MLGGGQARADAAHAAERWNAVRITTASRPDLSKQTGSLLARLGFEADRIATTPSVPEKHVKPIGEWELTASSASAEVRALAGAHVALWKRCAAENKPMLILEDGILLPPKLDKIGAHLMAVVERVCDVSETPVLLVLGAAVDPSSGWTEQWLPTDLQQQHDGERVVLREPHEFHGSFAYVVWPCTARRLLASLPMASAVDAFLSRTLHQGTVRALVAQPALAAARREPYVQRVRYQVVHTRVAVRATPTTDGFVEGARSQGDVLEAIGLSDDREWIKLGERAFVMLRHPEHGTLLERLDPEEAEDEEAV